LTKDDRRWPALCRLDGWAETPWQCRAVGLTYGSAQPLCQTSAYSGVSIVAKSCCWAKGPLRFPNHRHSQQDPPKRSHAAPAIRFGIGFVSAALAGGVHRRPVETCQDDRETLPAAPFKWTYTPLFKRLATQTAYLGMAVAVVIVGRRYVGRSGCQRLEAGWRDATPYTLRNWTIIAGAVRRSAAVS
jgi:hypothetical protein